MFMMDTKNYFEFCYLPHLVQFPQKVTHHIIHIFCCLFKILFCSCLNDPDGKSYDIYKLLQKKNLHKSPSKPKCLLIYVVKHLALYT